MKVERFASHPDEYLHWNLSVDQEIATLTMDVQEEDGDGYIRKLNSYDIFVDIELNDAVTRILFEYPEVKSVVITSGKDRIFCSGANIPMLASSPHAFKVNFCKYTNETRNSLEDISAHGGPKFLAALNGVASGGGYEVRGIPLVTSGAPHCRKNPREKLGYAGLVGGTHQSRLAQKYRRE